MLARLDQLLWAEIIPLLENAMKRIVLLHYHQKTCATPEAS